MISRFLCAETVTTLIFTSLGAFIGKDGCKNGTAFSTPHSVREELRRTVLQSAWRNSGGDQLSARDSPADLDAVAPEGNAATKCLLLNGESRRQDLKRCDSTAAIKRLEADLSDARRDDSMLEVGCELEYKLVYLSDFALDGNLLSVVRSRTLSCRTGFHPRRKNRSREPP